MLPKAGAQLAAAKSGADADTIGKLYFSAGNYAPAAAALQKAVAMGGAPDADAASMLLGIAQKRAGNKAAAMKAFDQIKDQKLAEVGRLWKTASR